MSIEEYFEQIQRNIDACAWILSSSVAYDKRSIDIGFVKGELWFFDKSILYFREFVKKQTRIEKYMYVYHFQDSEGKIRFRYDNTPHFPDLSTFPHHKHCESESNVVDSEEPDLSGVLEEVLDWFPPSS